MLVTKIEYSLHFLSERKKFVRNNRKRYMDFAKTISLFLTNCFHPSLNIKKLKGIDIYTLRLNKGDRIFFIWKNKKTALFLDIGKHDKYRDY